MEWCDVDKFKDRIGEIEQFFVELAANEEQILISGFRYALALPSAKAALKALTTFNEDFSALRRFMLRIDKTFAQELEQLDTQGKIIEEVALIGLRLRMAEARTATSSGISLLNQLMLNIPYMSKLALSKGLFGETPMSLQRAIINLERLRGIAGMFAEYVSNRYLADDEVFKPSNIKPDRVVDMIDRAIAELDSIPSLPARELERLQSYLLEAKKEALSASPSWSKIVGALVIVAAVTSGLADAPGAAKTIKDAIEYVLGTSVIKPLQNYLPAPNEPYAPPPRNMA